MRGIVMTKKQRRVGRSRPLTERVRAPDKDLAHTATQGAQGHSIDTDTSSGTEVSRPWHVYSQQQPRRYPPEKHQNLRKERNHTQ